MKLNKACKCRFSEDDIYKCANTRLGWYRRSGMNIVNFIISLKVLSIKKGDRPGLVYHLDYYLKSDINVEPYTRHVRRFNGRINYQIYSFTLLMK